ncbi:uncharacterized protein LOC123879623 [Maniola jurtina]|uniref:uncharacterized protein LOC123879623 n=1 Tax=Maniola jurtina TaxID=191418 RepID=UPI001E687229|nr:uncharacterized protein LOC123879623 [Maniola jurtina]
MSYTNEEYYEMVRVYLCNKTLTGARTMYQNESVRRLRAQGFKNPAVPSPAAILRANQRLRDYGQFATPGHAAGAGRTRTRKKEKLEDKILKFFEQNPTASTREAGRLFGVCSTTVWRLLNDTSLDSQLDSEPNNVLREKWAKALSQQLTPNQFVCEKHFREEDIKKADRIIINGAETIIPRERRTLLNDNVIPINLQDLEMDISEEVCECHNYYFKMILKFKKYQICLLYF